jgi:hypothetical protein
VQPAGDSSDIYLSEPTSCVHRINGICFTSRRLACVSTDATDAILVKCEDVNEAVELQLFESFCLPLLTYCRGALIIPQNTFKHLTVCWNDYFRKIFHFNRWNTVTDFQFYCGGFSLDCIYDPCKLNFSNVKHIAMLDF